MASPAPPLPPSSRPPWRERFSRWIRILVPVAVVGVILVTVAGVGFVEYSGRPSFCKNCHIMQPYYDSWATSSHRNVPCIMCHYAPGVRAEAMGKFQAANQVVKYVTGAYGMKPWAEIEDAACLRSGCHSERKVAGTINYRGVPFDHQHHLGELRRGKQLRCTSCHSQIVQGEHVAVTEETCILCHFKDRPAATPLAGCTGCHRSPPRIVTPDGSVVEHARYVEQGISCLSCHGEVAQGTGAAERSRCFNCHNEPERLARFDETPFMHRVHITDHNVECGQCHTPIVHRVVSLASSFELDCRSCHARAHDLQRRLFAGVGGHGAADNPSKMFRARVSCVGCHERTERVQGHEDVRLADEASCLACHGVRFANVLPTWRRDMDRKVQRVEQVVRGARGALGTAPVRGRATADSLLRLAEENVAFVRGGRGAHNIVYADQLLRAGLGLVRQAVRAGPLAYGVPQVDLGPPLDEGACLTCHLGAEQLEVRVGTSTFRHSPHVLRGGLQCAQCHTTLERHGGTTITAPDGCNSCHHQPIRPMNCARCHAGPGGAPEATIRLPAGDFSHDPHRRANLACSTCHQPPAMDARQLDCRTCHDRHHTPDRSCLSCHRGGAQGAHTRVAHTGCVQCHQSTLALVRWTREVCTACHADKTQHYAPRACDSCHRLPAPAARAPVG